MTSRQRSRNFGRVDEQRVVGIGTRQVEDFGIKGVTDEVADVRRQFTGEDLAAGAGQSLVSLGTGTG